MRYTIEPVAIVHSPYTDKFGIPRQPGLVPSAKATIEFIAPYNTADAVRGLEGFSHIWLNFLFHKHLDRKYSATVRPPRLGGQQKVGVFASRSSFRPNAMGQSCVALDEIDASDRHLILRVSGIDLLDQTPIIDVKPYLPYSDSHPNALGGFAPQAPAQLIVEFTEEAAEQCEQFHEAYPLLGTLITEIIRQDPRPAYHNGRISKSYGFKLYQLNICFHVLENQAMVTEVSLP